ncbi:MAG: hypothetical protein ACREDR_36950, partial [Blastocatellia bacterium]
HYIVRRFSLLSRTSLIEASLAGKGIGHGASNNLSTLGGRALIRNLRLSRSISFCFGRHI